MIVCNTWCVCVHVYMCVYMRMCVHVRVGDVPPQVSPTMIMYGV